MIGARFALLLTLLLPACAAVDTPEACKVTRAFEAPMRKVGDYQTVDARLDEKPARLIVDTGMNLTALGPPSAKRLGLREDHTRFIPASGAGGRMDSWVALPETLQLGGHTFDAQPIYVAFGQIAAIKNGSVDGVFGTDMLSQFDVDFDPAHETVTFYKPRRCPHGPPPFAGPSTTLPTSSALGNRIAIPIQIDGVPMSALLDTGAPVTFVNMRRMNLKPADLADDRLDPAKPHISGPVRHKFKQLQFGDQTVVDPVLIVGDGKMTGVDAVIGTDMLKNRRLWISYAGRTITIGAPQPPTPTNPRNPE